MVHARGELKAGQQPVDNQDLTLNLCNTNEQFAF